jgi:hypothetical protein
VRLSKRVSKLEAALAKKSPPGPYPPAGPEPTDDEFERFLAGEDVPGVPIDRGAWNDFLSRLAEREQRQAAAGAETATEDPDPCGPPPAATTGFPDDPPETLSHGS